MDILYFHSFLQTSIFKMDYLLKIQFHSIVDEHEEMDKMQESPFVH